MPVAGGLTGEARSPTPVVSLPPAVKPAVKPKLDGDLHLSAN